MNCPQPNSLFLPDEKKQWFVEDRFGMFIHMGLYSLAARHEWVQSFEKIPAEDYAKYFEHFDPDLYDPCDWARHAKAAGMKYVVLTTKHHEGFCLWDTAATGYKVTNTPHGRDMVLPFVEAFRAEGLKVGFYYSLLDWHHSNFPADIYHPERDNPDVSAFNDGRDMSSYVAYMKDQVRELLTQFGRIDILWFDFSYPDEHYKDFPGKGFRDWCSDELVKLVRELQPHIIINNRLDLVGHTGELPDITTPEQYVPQTRPTIEGCDIAWEACHTLSGSWGYFRDEESWKSPEQLIQILVESVALGGNFLMNIGPNGRGALDHRTIAALDVYADWLRLNGRSIYGCGEASGISIPKDCRLTRRENRLYVHVFNWPFRHLHIPGLGGKVEYAQLLHDGSEITWIDPHAKVDPNVGVSISAQTLTLELPVKKPQVTVPVIEIFLKP